jgi:hypothetical protein
MLAWMGGSKKKLKQGAKKHDGKIRRPQGTKKVEAALQLPHKSPGKFPSLWRTFRLSIVSLLLSCKIGEWQDASIQLTNSAKDLD